MVIPTPKTLHEAITRSIGNSYWGDGGALKKTCTIPKAAGTAYVICTPWRSLPDPGSQPLGEGESKACHPHRRWSHRGQRVLPVIDLEPTERSISEVEEGKTPYNR